MIGGIAMLSVKDIVQELTELDEPDLEQVSEYISFLRFRARHKISLILDEKNLALLYAQFSDEDKELAELGMSDYVDGLKEEDKL
jgi:ABC-type phosphate transport system auxiliary subunit